MKSHSTSIPDNTRHKTEGFTLIETLVVLAILITLSAIGFVAGVDSYQRYQFRSDTESAVFLLKKARSSAMNNIGEASHGVYFCASNKFILFRGTSYGALPAYDLAVSKTATVTSCPTPNTVVFAPLSGTTTGATITLSDGVRSVAIIINNEGGITW